MSKRIVHGPGEQDKQKRAKVKCSKKECNHEKDITGLIMTLGRGGGVTQNVWLGMRKPDHREGSECRERFLCAAKYIFCIVNSASSHLERRINTATHAFLPCYVTERIWEMQKDETETGKQRQREQERERQPVCRDASRGRNLVSMATCGRLSSRCPFQL